MPPVAPPAGAVPAGRAVGKTRTLISSRGTAALEFAIIALPFLLLLLFVFEISFDLFAQEALDSALHLAVRQVQTGNAQNAQSGNDFVTNYLCPNLDGLISCSGISVSIATFVPTTVQDFYDFTTGEPPTTGGSLDMSSYASAAFCNAGPSQYVVFSAILVGPSFIGALLPNAIALNYQGQWVHATLSTAGMVTENFQSATPTQSSAPAC